jgi:hypothetical protein
MEEIATLLSVARKVLSKHSVLSFMYCIVLSIMLFSKRMDMVI